MRTAVLILLFASGLLGCTKPRTEILVRVYGDRIVQEQLASLSISIWHEKDGRWRELLAARAAPRAELVWPVEVGIVQKTADPGRIEIVATAHDSEGDVLIHDRSLARFTPSRTRVLRLDLRGECLKRSDCGAPTCRGSTCRVCDVSEEGAVCVRAEERATERHTATTYQPTDEPVGPAPDMPLVDAPCRDEGLRTCRAKGTRERLQCTNGTWQPTAACKEEEVCDSRQGPSQGACLARCNAGHPGSFCIDDVNLEHCSEDGARLEARACPVGTSCAGHPAEASCVDLDECDLEPQLCSPGICVNTFGGYHCACPQGYTGERACTFEEECDWETCVLGHCSAEVPGGAEQCQCSAGFVREGIECTDVDECAGANPCAGACINSPGSYACACGTDSACDPWSPCRVSSGEATCIGEWADWPMPNHEPGAPHGAQYELTRDGTVRDLVTTLEWLATPREGTWTEALDTCAGLEFAGHDDWRLPSAIELLSITDHTVTAPASDLLFGGSPTRTELTRSRAYRVDEFSGPEIVTWTLNFQLGELQAVYYSESVEHYRCVRGPEGEVVSKASRYTFLGADEELVADKQTRLVWTRVSEEWLDFDAAVAHCEAVSLAGYGDFRLPTLNELFTLMDVAAFERSPLILGDSEFATTWSASPYSSTAYWTLIWSTAWFTSNSTDNENDVLCVHALESP